MRLKGKVEKSSFESGCFDVDREAGVRMDLQKRFPAGGPVSLVALGGSQRCSDDTTYLNEVDFNFKHGDEIGAAQI